MSGYLPAARLNTKEVAELLGTTRQTLAVWRGQKKGPPFYRHVGRVWYDRELLSEWQRRNTEMCGAK